MEPRVLKTKERKGTGKRPAARSLVCREAPHERLIGQAVEETQQFGALGVAERRVRQAPIVPAGACPDRGVMPEYRIEGREASVMHVGGGERHVAQSGHAHRT